MTRLQTGEGAPVVYELGDNIWAASPDDRVVKELQQHIDDLFNSMESKMFNPWALLIIGPIKVIGCLPQASEKIEIK
jgi:hypothetical protein